MSNLDRSDDDCLIFMAFHRFNFSGVSPSKTAPTVIDADDDEVPTESRSSTVRGDEATWLVAGPGD
jgi:hypothetical protein